MGLLGCRVQLLQDLLAMSLQRSSVDCTLPVSSWCTMGLRSAEALPSLSPWHSCDTSLVLASSLHVPSTTNLKLFFQCLLFHWLLWSPYVDLSSVSHCCFLSLFLLNSVWGGVFSVGPVFRAEGLGSACYKATVQDRCCMMCKELLRKKWACLHFSVGCSKGPLDTPLSSAFQQPWLENLTCTNCKRYMCCFMLYPVPYFCNV